MFRGSVGRDVETRSLSSRDHPGHMLQVARLLHHAATNDGLHQQRVDVATAQHRTNALADIDANLDESRVLRPLQARWCSSSRQPGATTPRNW